MLWKNANHSLLDSIFCFKLFKSTRVSDCPLLSLGKFLALIPRYILLTYSIDNEFKLLLVTVNFITVLNHSLYVSLTLIASHAIVSIIQRALFGAVDSQALLTSIRSSYFMTETAFLTLSGTKRVSFIALQFFFFFFFEGGGGAARHCCVNF